MAFVLVGVSLASPVTTVTIASPSGISGQYTTSMGGPGPVTSFSIVTSFQYTTGAAGILVDEVNQPNLSAGWHDSQLEVDGGSVYSSVWPYGASIDLGTANIGSNTATFSYNGATGTLTGQLNSDSPVSIVMGRLNPISSGFGAQIWGFGVPDTTNIVNAPVYPVYLQGYSDTITAATVTVPEPSIAALLIPCLGFLGVIRKKLTA